MTLSAARILKVLTRDAHTCVYCGTPGGDLHVDHVVPQSWGGSNEYDNLVTSCARCNIEKSAMNLNVYMHFLRERDGVDTDPIRARVLAALKRAVK